MRVSAWTAATLVWILLTAGVCRIDLSAEARPANTEGQSAEAEPAAAETVGRLLARAGTLRQMSLAVAGMLQDGETPAREAALVKDVGNDYEQALPETIRKLFDPARTPDEVQEMQRIMTMVARSYSLRGGTREILRGIIARQLGLR